MKKPETNPFQTAPATTAPIVVDIPQYCTIQFIREEGCQSRSAIAERIGYSAAKVTSIVNELIDEGILIEVGDSTYTGGRRAREIGFNPDFGYLLTATINQDRLDVALIDFDEKIRVRRLIPIDGMNDPLTVVDQICRFALERLQQLKIPIAKVFGVGFSVPSAIDLESGTLFETDEMPGWGGYQIESHLREVFPYALVVLERDANAMVFGELRKGMGQGHRHILYVKTDSSISTGLILGRSIYRGANGRAGSISSIRQSPEDTSSERGERIGRVLAVLVDLLDPELILLGGDADTLGHEYLAAIRRSILSLSQSSATRNLRVEITKLGAEANMIGLIALTAEHIFVPDN